MTNVILSLPDRMRAAADTLEEVSALYGYPNGQHAPWSASELRTEADHVAADYPDSSACDAAARAGAGSADAARPAPTLPRPGAGRASIKPHN